MRAGAPSAARRAQRHGYHHGRPSDGGTARLTASAAEVNLARREGTPVTNTTAQTTSAASLPPAEHRESPLQRRGLPMIRLAARRSGRAWWTFRAYEPSISRPAVTHTTKAMFDRSVPVAAAAGPAPGIGSSVRSPA
jgi:hypothetical protein